MLSLRFTTGELKIHEHVQVYSTALISERDDTDREKQKHSTNFQQSNKMIHTSLLYHPKFQKTGLRLINCSMRGVFKKLCIIIERISLCKKVERRNYCILCRSHVTWKSEWTTFSSKWSSFTSIDTVYTSIFIPHAECVFFKFMYTWHQMSSLYRFSGREPISSLLNHWRIESVSRTESSILSHVSQWKAYHHKQNTKLHDAFSRNAQLAYAHSSLLEGRVCGVITLYVVIQRNCSA